MDFDEIKILIEKYFNAETSLKEEKLLKDYFRGSEIASELEVYRPVFEKNIPEPLDQTFDEKIFKLIDDNKTVKKTTTGKIFPTWLKIAAMFVLILAGGILWYNQNKTQKITSPETVQIQNEVSAIKDTYTDPEQAKKELEKALALLSSKLDQGNKAAAEQVNRLQIISKVIPEKN